MQNNQDTALPSSLQPTSIEEPQTKNQKFYVIFTDHGNVWWLKWLKPGFRHCLVAVEEEGNWAYIEAVLSGMEIKATTVNCLGVLAADGCTVVEARQFQKLYHKLAPIEPISCVTVVKRILRLNHWFILTPHQLYKYLKKSVDSIDGL